MTESVMRMVPCIRLMHTVPVHQPSDDGLYIVVVLGMSHSSCIRQGYLGI